MSVQRAALYAHAADGDQICSGTVKKAARVIRSIDGHGTLNDKFVALVTDMAQREFTGHRDRGPRTGMIEAQLGLLEHADRAAYVAKRQRPQREVGDAGQDTGGSC